MTTEPRPFGQQLAGLAGAGFRSFAGTFAVVLLAGIVLAGVSWSYVRPHSTGYALLAFGLAIIEAIAAAVFLGAQRAALSAAAYGFETCRLGGTIVRFFFDRITGAFGAEGTDSNRIAHGLERLPLARAEKLLNDGVRSLLGDLATGGGLQRKLHRRLVTGIGEYTLARFREADADHGGIDVPKLREHLERTVDAAVARKIRAARWMPMLMAAIGLPVVVAAQTWAFNEWIAPSNGLPETGRQIRDDTDSFKGAITASPAPFNRMLVEAGVLSNRVSARTAEAS